MARTTCYSSPSKSPNDQVTVVGAAADFPLIVRTDEEPTSETPTITIPIRTPANNQQPQWLIKDEQGRSLPKIEGEDMGALSTRQGAKFDQMIEYVEQSGIPPEDAGGHIWESQVDYWKTIAREIAKTFCPGMRVHSQGRADNWVRIEVKNKAMLAMLAMFLGMGSAWGTAVTDVRPMVKLVCLAIAEKGTEREAHRALQHG